MDLDDLLDEVISGDKGNEAGKNYALSNRRKG